MHYSENNVKSGIVVSCKVYATLISQETIFVSPAVVNQRREMARR